jgi:hypothetical protein
MVARVPADDNEASCDSYPSQLIEHLRFIKLTA